MNSLAPDPEVSNVVQKEWDEETLYFWPKDWKRELVKFREDGKYAPVFFSPFSPLSWASVVRQFNGHVVVATKATGNEKLQSPNSEGREPSSLIEAQLPEGGAKPHCFICPLLFSCHHCTIAEMDSLWPVDYKGGFQVTRKYEERVEGKNSDDRSHKAAY